MADFDPRIDDIRAEKPHTEAGRTLLRQWDGNPAEEDVRIVVLAIERQAFWNGVKSVEEVHNPTSKRATSVESDER